MWREGRSDSERERRVGGREGGFHVAGWKGDVDLDLGWECSWVRGGVGWLAGGAAGRDVFLFIVFYSDTAGGDSEAWIFLYRDC